MAFKITHNPEVTLKVVVRELSNNDKVQKSELNVTYRRMSVSEYDDFQRRVIETTKLYNINLTDKTKTSIDLEETLNTLYREALENTVQNVFPLLNEDDEEIEFTTETFNYLLEYQPAFAALNEGFQRLHNGRAEQEKNSSKRGGTGR